MREPQYIEGHKARQNFEEGMKSLFKAPKEKAAKAAKKNASRPSQTKKPKLFDKD